MAGIEDDFVYDNEEESEMGQIHAIHLNLNAIAAVRRSMHTGVSRLDCMDCSESIPLARRLAAAGCLRCLHCQAAAEHQCCNSG